MTCKKLQNRPVTLLLPSYVFQNRDKDVEGNIKDVTNITNYKNYKITNVVSL